MVEYTTIFGDAQSLPGKLQRDRDFDLYVQRDSHEVSMDKAVRVRVDLYVEDHHVVFRSPRYLQLKNSVLARLRRQDRYDLSWAQNNRVRSFVATVDDRWQLLFAPQTARRVARSNLSRLCFNNDFSHDSFSSGIR